MFKSQEEETQKAEVPQNLSRHKPNLDNGLYKSHDRESNETACRSNPQTSLDARPLPDISEIKASPFKRARHSQGN